MPSFLSKLKLSSSNKANNPYTNPYHPSHQPISQRSKSQPNLPLPRPASPRETHDFLAEARQTANRDPITGRLLPQQRPTAIGIPNQTASESNLDANARVNGALNAIERLGPSAERSAYLNRASRTPQTTGRRYDLVAGMGRRKREEEARKREEEERVRIARGGTEYYAPERHYSEFYAGPVRD